MASVTFYQTLQVASDASQADIAAAYRRLARRFHPDLNPSPDAHRQMQLLNEAYNTLRHPEQRLRYDESLAARQRVATRAVHQPPPSPAAASSRVRHPSVAWLSYQKRVGDDIVFTIGHADNMADLLATLQRRIPPAGRRYEIAHNRWHVHTAHEDVLRTLFRNYAPVTQSPPPVSPPRRRRAAPAAPPHRTAYTRADTGERKTWMGVGLAIAAAFSLYLLIFGRVLLSESVVATGVAAAIPGAEVASSDITSDGEQYAATNAPLAAAADFVFPDDCTPTRIGQAPTYFREACKTLERDPRLVTPAPSRPYAMAATRVASNIRSGPDTRFPVLTTTPPGARIQVIGYTINRGYVWYLTNFGGWIRSDLLVEPPGELPLVGM